jgi:hypothetical protein
MLGYEPPQPKFSKALAAAAAVVFPFTYIFDVALLRHQPSWLCLIIACVLTVLVALQTYGGFARMLYMINNTVWWFGISRAALSLLRDRSKLDDDTKRAHDSIKAAPKSLV